MARTRNIKPGFFKNESLAECPPLARILFAGLWTIADRAGRLEDRPKRIKAEVLPYDECDVDVLLEHLAVRGFIVRYIVDGESYIQVAAWAKHQQPHIKESESTLPGPDKADASSELAPVKHGASTGLISPHPLTLNRILDSGVPEERARAREAAPASGSSDGAPSSATASASVGEPQSQVVTLRPVPKGGSQRPHPRMQDLVEESALRLLDRPRLSGTQRRLITNFCDEHHRGLSPPLIEQAELETGKYTGGECLEYFFAVMRRMIERPEDNRPRKAANGNGNAANRSQRLSKGERNIAHYQDLQRRARELVETGQGTGDGEGSVRRLPGSGS